MSDGLAEQELLWITYRKPSLSVLTATFSGGPGLAGFIGIRIMEVVVTTGAIRRAKLQSNRHHQQINIDLFTGLTNSVEALKGKLIGNHTKSNKFCYL